MKTLDCLFLHPTTHFRTSLYEDRLVYVIMPVGLPAIADLLDREGYETKVIHTGLEQMLDPSFNVENVFKTYDAKIVGIDLNWFVHAYDALRIADIVKRSSNAFVVLGGFTASFFAEEILSSFNCVDAIIWGDSEIPLLEVAKSVSKKESRDPPNLLYRSGRSIKKSQRKYVANEHDLNKLDFSSLRLVKNWDKYTKLIHDHADLSPKLMTLGWTCVGRGCSVNCSYCGGGRDAQRILTGRHYPIFRSKEKVVETLARFEEMGITCAYIDFDPDPSRREYYNDFFTMVRKERIDISAQLLLWSLSSDSILRDFKRTFNPLYSTITVSPESGSEHIRKLNKGFHYSNEELFRWLNCTKNEAIPIDLFFTSGLSWETEKHFKETIQLAKKIASHYPNVLGMYCYPIKLEPCSPRFLFPRRHKVSLKFKKFIDFHNAYEKAAKGLPLTSELGYRTDYLSETKIIELSQQFGLELERASDALQVGGKSCNR